MSSFTTTAQKRTQYENPAEVKRTKESYPLLMTDSFYSWNKGLLNELKRVYGVNVFLDELPDFMVLTNSELIEKNTDVRKLLTTNLSSGKLMLPAKNSLDYIAITDFIETKKKLKEKFIEAQPKIFQEILELISEQSKIRIKINLTDYDRVEHNNDVIGLMKIIKATHTQALADVSFIDQQNISDLLSQIKQGNMEITVYNDVYASLYDRYVKAGLPELTPPQIISRYVMSLNENFHREKMFILKVADKMINYYHKISSDPSYTRRNYDREREKNDNFPLDLPDAMQKMVNAELISNAVKPTSQTSQHLATPHEGLAFNMVDAQSCCPASINCVFCHCKSHCACKCDKLKSFMKDNKAAYQAAIHTNYQRKGGAKDNYGGRSGTYRGGKSQAARGRGSWSQSNSRQGKGGAKGSYQQHDSNTYRGAEIFNNNSERGRYGESPGHVNSHEKDYGSYQCANSYDEDYCDVDYDCNNNEYDGYTDTNGQENYQCEK